MKKILLTTVAIMSLGTPVKAEELTGHVTFTTDYVFRGTSQTDEHAAIQGGLDFAHETGLHAGVWGSSIDFDTVGAGSMELDIYGGYAGEIGDFNYDVGGIYYLYPGSDDNLNYDFWEVYATAGYAFDFMSLHAGVYYSPEFFGDTGDAYYYTFGAEAPVMEDLFTLSTHIGRQTIDDAQNYTDWSVGAEKTWMDFDWAATYHDTNLDNNDLGESRAVLSVSKSF